MTGTTRHGNDVNQLQVLLEGRGEPTTVRVTQTLRHAIEQMIEHGYSQLPVVDDEQRPVALLTQADVLRSMMHVGDDVDRVARSLVRLCGEVGMRTGGW